MSKGVYQMVSDMFKMETNKERIENIDIKRRGLHDSMSRTELGLIDKFQ